MNLNSKTLLLPTMILLMGTLFGTDAINVFAESPFDSGATRPGEVKKNSEMQEQQIVQVQAGKPDVIPPGGVSHVADDSVTTLSIKDGEVNTQDLADGAVTSGKIGSDAVTSSKIANGAITLQQRQVVKEFDCCTPGSSFTIHATCADDEVVSGGGYEAAASGGIHTVIFSGQQSAFPKDWVVTMQGGAEDEPSSVYAECLKILP